MAIIKFKDRLGKACKTLEIKLKRQHSEIEVEHYNAGAILRHRFAFLHMLAVLYIAKTDHQTCPNASKLASTKINRKQEYLSINYCNHTTFQTFLKTNRKRMKAKINTMFAAG